MPILSHIRALSPLIAAGLVVAGWLAGPPWAAIAVLFLLFHGTMRGSDEDAPSVAHLPVLLGLAHFLVLYVAVFAAARSSFPATAAPLFATALYLAQVSNSAAHELIHMKQRWPARLGIAVFASHLFGHHNSAHRLVHHVHVATARDPNSAPAGTSLYAFLPRAALGSFRAGLAAEAKRKNAAIYAGYLSISATTLLISFGLGGTRGLLIHVGLALYASLILMATDYVQHYGLTRALGPNGKPVPVGPEHAWDAPASLADRLMLNAPRHARHHMQPATEYDGLDRPANAPTLPYPLSVMIWLAFLPRLWRQVMDPRLARITPR